ncbi:MAG: hypothetical protein ACI83N_001936, partial [Hydrogenophaga sp.]
LGLSLRRQAGKGGQGQGSGEWSDAGDRHENSL